MRKGIILSIAFILFSSNAYAGDVFPDSTGNTLNIRVTNTNGAFGITQVKVTKQSLPDWVTGFTPNEVNFGTITANQSATATFTFNIPSNSQIGNSGDIRFQVSAGSGDSWSKNVGLSVINPNGAIKGNVNVEGAATPNGAILTITGQVNRSITLGTTGGYTIDNLPAGTYTLTVAKTGYMPVPAKITRKVNYGQTISDIDFNLIKPPQPPTLRSPANNSNVDTPTPGYDWNAADGGGTKKYRIQIDTNNNFSQPIDISNIASTKYTPNFSIMNNTTYYWHVQVSNEAGTSSWSETWNFTTKILPPAPTLSSPSDGSTINSLQPSFSWDNTPHAASYRIQIDDNSNFSSTIINTPGLTSSSYNYTENLAINTRYYWRVCASNAIGDSPSWSSRWYFNTPSLPSTPGLSSPSNGITISDTDDVGFSWDSVSNATSYHIQVAKNNFFLDTAVNTTTSSTSYTSYNLDNNTTYYWRVQSSNAAGTSSWSSSRWFKIDLKGKIYGNVQKPSGFPLGIGWATVELVKDRRVIKSVGTIYVYIPWVCGPGDYTIEDITPEYYDVKASKSGYQSKTETNVSVSAGGETRVNFVLESTQPSATIVLSSPSTIRNASVYSPVVKALRSMVLDSSRGTPTKAALSALTTSVTPVLSSGEVNALVNTSISLLEVPPSLSYTVEGEKPQKVELRGSGANFTGQMYIESTTPEGTSTFHYYAVDKNGSVSTQIEYGSEFVIDTTIYPDEGGQVSNRDGAAARLLPGASPVPVNITITSPQSENGPQRSLANNISSPLEINDIPYVPLPDSMRQFHAQIDEKEPPHGEDRRISTLNEMGQELKGVTISLPYPDQDQDGIVDNAMLDEESLKILQLKNGRWEVIEDCEIDRGRNIVSAQVSGLTTVMLTGAKVIASVEDIISYPNPWYQEKDNYVKITFIPFNSQPKIYIYNIAGELVRTLHDGQEINSTPQGYMEAVWDGKNDSDDNVASGIYLYLIKCNKGEKTGKIGIIR